MVGRDKSGAWDEYTHTTIYKRDNQQGPTVEHRELYSVFCNLGKRIWNIIIREKNNNLYGKRIQQRIDVCITDSLCCTEETNTTL